MGAHQLIRVLPGNNLNNLRDSLVRIVTAATVFNMKRRRKNALKLNSTGVLRTGGSSALSTKSLRTEMSEKSHSETWIVFIKTDTLKI